MTLEIITPEKLFFKGEVDLITLPGKLGSFTVLKNHAPLIAELCNESNCSNKIRIKDDKKDFSFKLGKGFVIIHNNHIVVSVESVNIDIETE